MPVPHDTGSAPLMTIPLDRSARVPKRTLVAFVLGALAQQGGDKNPSVGGLGASDALQMVSSMPLTSLFGFGAPDPEGIVAALLHRVAEASDTPIATKEDPE